MQHFVLEVVWVGKLSPAPWIRSLGSPAALWSLTVPVRGVQGGYHDTCSWPQPCPQCPSSLLPHPWPLLFSLLEVSVQQTGRGGKCVRLCREGEEFSINNNNNNNNNTCHVGSTCQFTKCIQTCALLAFQRWGIVTLVSWFPAFVTAPMFKQATFYFFFFLQLSAHCGVQAFI